MNATTERNNRYQEDHRRLLDYVETGSEAAFAQLVRAHLSFVYSVCLRELHDRDSAHDAAQTVFLILAQKAKSIRRGAALTSWLFQTSCLVARDYRRKERTRLLYEEDAFRQKVEKESASANEWQEEVWRRIDPHLNRALASLKPGERDAVLLRFFDEMSLREVGDALRISEDSARMRINRALEKMRRALAGAGIVIGVGALSALLTEHAANAAVPPSNLLAGLNPPYGSPQQARAVRQTIGRMKLLSYKPAFLAVAGATLALSGYLTTAHYLPTNRPAAGRASTVAPLHPADDAEVRGFLAALTLPDNFSLRATSASHAVITDADRRLYVDSHRKTLDAGLRSGTISRAQYDQNLKAYENMVSSDNPSFAYRLTTVISGRQSGVAAELRGEYKIGPEPYFALVFNGGETVYILGKELQRTAGAPFAALRENRRWLAMPGLGTGLIPIVRSVNREDTAAYLASSEGAVTRLRCEVYTEEEGGPSDAYAEGVAVVKKSRGKPQILSMNPDGLADARLPEWRFSDFALLKGVWAAKRIVQTSYAPTAFEPKPGTNGKEFTNRLLPLYETDTHIKQISASSLPDAAFEIEKRVSKERGTR